MLAFKGTAIGGVGARPIKRIKRFRQGSVVRTSIVHHLPGENGHLPGVEGGILFYHGRNQTWPNQGIDVGNAVTFKNPRVLLVPFLHRVA